MRKIKIHKLKATEVIRLKSKINTKFRYSLHRYSTNESICPQPLSSTGIWMLIALIFNGFCSLIQPLKTDDSVPTREPSLTYLLLTSY